MALSTYDELQASIADWVNREDLTDVIPDFISLCEARLRRALRARRMRVRSTITLDTTGVYTLPVGVKEVVSLYLNETDMKGVIGFTTAERVNLMRAQWGPTGVPQLVALVDRDLLFGPVPDREYTAEIVWDLELTALSDSATSNWMLTYYPDVYLYGSLVHSAPYLKDDERIATWQSLFDKALSELELDRDAAEFGANTPVIRRPSALGE